MKRLLPTVLIFEAIVVGLAVPVAVHIDHLRPGSAGVAAGWHGRRRGAVRDPGPAAAAAATVVGGSVLQVFVIASGVIVPVMYFLGAIFALLWVVGIWLGRRIERPAAP